MTQRQKDIKTATATLLISLAIMMMMLASCSPYKNCEGFGWKEARKAYLR